MKRLTFLALVLLLALPAVAGSYTLTTTTNADAVLANIVADTNEATCTYYGLPVSCTQAQARRAFCRAANLGDVATCAGATQVDVYADVQSCLQREVLRLVKEEYGPKSDAKRAAAFEKNPLGATTAQKNAWCSVHGLPNGCLP